MAVEAKKAAKALRNIMSAASANSDTPIASIVQDSEVAERVSDILVQMGYATVTDGNIRLTEAGEAQKNA
jgi:predicted methyltransferase